MSDSKPHISIITPVLNAEQTLAETLESVVVQNLSGVEHLLIDACSTDGTLEIAASYPHLTIISESDSGIYDGMNKGAGLASGEWLLFLQADDWLPMGALASYRDAIEINRSAMMICGGAEAVKNEDGNWVRVWSVNDPERKKLTVENIALGEPMINARLIRKDYFNKLEGFSLDFSLAADRDFLLRAACLSGEKIEIQAMTYRYRWHSGSSTMTEGNELSERLSSENLAIVKKHFPVANVNQRGVLKQWHTNLTVQAAMNAIESFRWNEVMHAAKEGVWIDPSWPLQILREIFRSLPGFLARGGRTRSQILSGVRSK